MPYLIAFFIVGFLIFIHEVGHYVAARLIGIPVARFSLGIGPALWSVRRGQTEYRISLVPLGGYVLPAQDSYFAHSPGARLFFAAGGPVANIALTFAFASAFNVLFYGFSWQALLVAPVQQTINALVLVVHALPKVLSASSDAIGPLGVVTEGGALVGSSVLLALQFGAILSMNLAMLNLIPVPPLDGGRIVLTMLELVWARAARLNVPLNVAGFLAILGFVTWLTTLDLRRLLSHLLSS